MTSSNRLKSVVSEKRMQAIAQLNGVSTRKTLNLNFSPSGRFGEAKSLMWVSLTCNSSQKNKRPPYTVEVVAMTKNEYPHFNPNNYGLDTKIATVRTGSHCKFNINYHIIWIPKYRRKLLTGKVAEVLRTILNGQCEDLGMEMLALEIMPDHIHLFVGANPTTTPFKLVKQLKGNTSIQLRRCFKDLLYLNYPKHWKRFKNLWAKGYYCGSAGHVSQEAVKRYILEQQGKDVFEYNVYGDPTGQSKIGKFAQTKLSNFGGVC